MLRITNKDHIHLRSTFRPACVTSKRYQPRVSVSQVQEPRGMNELGNASQSWIDAPRPGIRHHRMTI